MKNELDILCDMLDLNCNRACDANEIVCAKRQLMKYTDGDREKLLKLKAQIQYTKSKQVKFLDFLIQFVTVVGLLLNILHALSNNKASAEYIIFAILVTVSMIAACAYKLAKDKTDSRKCQWIIYIDTAIDELLREDLQRERHN